ncbi:hypothetical protein HYX17_02815 [Candidatus Woesearchaeota archaeon]|nr:hypothetical protein [Candidatus Woesearchaeota archaeon]
MQKKAFLILIIILLIIPMSLAAGGGGGGSGGGGSSSGSSGGTKITFTDENKNIIKNVRESRVEEITLSDLNKYDFTVINVLAEEAEFSVGNSKSIKIKTNEAKKFDLNNDNRYDLSIALFSISSNTGQFSFNEIAELIPEEPKKNEEVVKCGNLNTIKERVKCRLELKDYELSQEQGLNYLPEECRKLTFRKECINRYEQTQKCWKFPVGDERISCVKGNLNLGNIKNEVALCNIKTSRDKTECKELIEEKVYNLIKFRFYDLEERAEELINNGVNAELVADFISEIEFKKIEFNEAKTKEEKKEIILEVRKIWIEFIKKAKLQLK